MKLHVIHFFCATGTSELLESTTSSSTGDLLFNFGNDEIFQGARTFVATIQDTDPPLGIGPNSSVTVTVVDDEGKWHGDLGRSS